MKKCPDCTREVAAPVAVCPFCGHRFFDAQPAPPEDAAPADPLAATQLSQPAIRPPPVAPRPGSHMVVMGEASRQPIPLTGKWGPWPWLLPLITVGAVVAIALLRAQPFPTELLEAPAATDLWPCDGAPRCVVAYLAPWDDASQGSLAALEAVRGQQSDALSVAVIVGAGERSRVEQMADAIGPDTFLDVEGAVLARLSADTVPMWFIVDGDGNVVEKVEGTYLPVERHLGALGLRP